MARITSRGPLWTVTDVTPDIPDYHQELDDGSYGWRIVVKCFLNQRPTVCALPCRFGAKDDAERGMEWLNKECPPGSFDGVKIAENIAKRFKSYLAWKQEIIPIACRF